MRILVFSDIHSDLGRLRELADTPADIYIAAGDLVTWSRGLSDCGRILEALGERVWVLPGNHESSEHITRFCGQFGFRDFHEKVFEVGGYHFAGLGYSNPTPFNTPGEYTEQELGDKLEVFAALSPLVLVCHAPPHETKLDQLGNGGHAGSRAVRDFIDRRQPEHFFCGHIHEAAGVTVALGATRASNVGKQGYLLEI